MGPRRVKVLSREPRMGRVIGQARSSRPAKDRKISLDTGAAPQATS